MRSDRGLELDRRDFDTILKEVCRISTVAEMTKPGKNGSVRISDHRDLGKLKLNGSGSDADGSAYGLTACVDRWRCGIDSG